MQDGLYTKSRGWGRCAGKEVSMRALVFLAVFVLLAVGSLVPPVAAQTTDAWIGTWTLNLAQSSYDPATLAPKNQTTRITASGGMLTAITDGADAEGKKIHTEITYTFDGKDYEYTGAPDANSTRVYTRVDDHHYCLLYTSDAAD